jgi:hypothetical protein
MRQSMSLSSFRVCRHFALHGLAFVLLASGGGCQVKDSNTPEKTATSKPVKLTHEQTLEWVREHKAWRKAKKTKPIWARAVEPDEIGKEYVTADHATENAQEGHWLCVGVAEEPWFQKPDKVEAKYDLDGEVEKQFAFDSKPHTYRIFKPKGNVWNWAAQVQGPGIEGFYVRPSYDMKNPLYSPAGGYVVTEDVADPDAGKLKDVWLVQQPLFESTYELEP